MKKLNHLKIIILVLLFLSLLWINITALDSSSYQRNNDSSQHQADSEANPKAEYKKHCSKISQIDPNYGNSHDVFVVEKLLRTYAYIADGWGGLVIIDITKLNNPRVVGQYSNTSETNAVFVMDNIAYVTQWDGRMLIIDVKNPSKPKKIGEFDESPRPWSVTGRDNFVFIADGYNGLIILDVSDPANPQEINSYSVNGWGIYDFHFREQYIFVVGRQLEILDISDLTDIKRVGTFKYNHLSFGLHVHEDVAIIFGWSYGLYCVNISDLTQPAEIFFYYDNIYDFVDGYVVDDVLYVLTEYSGLISLNFSVPSNLQKIGEFRLSGYYYHAFFTDERFYLADIHGGVRIIELGDSPGELHFVGHFVDGGSAYEIYIEDSIAYMANGYNGLMIFDVKNPRKPKLLSNHFSGSTLYESIVVENNYAYLLNRYTLELDVYDVSNPILPVKLTSDSREHYLHWFRSEIDLENSKAYIISAGSTMWGDVYSILKIMNTSNVHNITELSTTSYYSDYMRDIQVQNDTIFLGSYRGLLILDGSNSSNIVEIGNYTSDYNRVYGLTISGNYAFLAIYNFGLKIVDISNLTNPFEVGSYRTSQHSYYYGGKRICYENGYVYMIDEDEGLLVFDVSDVTRPNLVGQFYEITDPYWIEDETYGKNLLNLFVKDNLVYMAASQDGFMIVHYDRLPMNSAFRNRNEIIGISSVLGVVLIVGSVLLFRIRKKHRNY